MKPIKFHPEHSEVWIVDGEKMLLWKEDDPKNQWAIRQNAEGRWEYRALPDSVHVLSARNWYPLAISGDWIEQFEKAIEPFLWDQNENNQS